MERVRRVRGTKKEDTATVKPVSAEDRIEKQYRDRATSPLRAIRAFCVLCMGCQPKKVTSCESTDCVLHPFRQGRNPFQKHRAKKQE